MGVQRALGAYRHDETGHELGCDCRECTSYTEADVRDALDCQWEPGRHQWLARFYLTTIEPDRIDLYDAPQWARDLAAVGDSVLAEKRAKRRREMKRRAKQKGSDHGRR